MFDLDNRVMIFQVLWMLIEQLKMLIMILFFYVSCSLSFSEAASQILLLVTVYIPWGWTFHRLNVKNYICTWEAKLYLCRLNGPCQTSNLGSISVLSSCVIIWMHIYFSLVYVNEWKKMPWWLFVHLSYGFEFLKEWINYNLIIDSSTCFIWIIVFFFLFWK